jgi:hypothetical protein
MGWVRTLAIVMAVLLVTTSCAHRADMSREQRRECRRLRTKAALAGVGGTVGVAVVATVLVVAVVASRGNIGSSSGGGGRRRRERRRERRRHRHQVCHEVMAPAPDEPLDGPIVNAPPPPAPTAPQPANAPPIGESPTEEQLMATFEGIQDEVRDCLGVGEVVQIDVNIDGPAGRVTEYRVHGMVLSATQDRCLGQQVARMRFQPFHDEMRVRFALDLGWVPPPPGAEPADN